MSTYRPTIPTSSRAATAVRVAQALLAVIAVSHVVVPLVMLARRSSLESDIAARHHDFTRREIVHSATIAIDAALVFHALLAVLCIVLIRAMPRRRPIVLRLTIVSQLAAIGFGFVSWSQSSMFHAVIPVVDALAVAVIVCVALIWPDRARS